MAVASYQSLADSSRVWIYRANRKLTDEEVIQVDAWSEKFITQWTAHSHSLNALSKVYHSQFLVIFLDEESSTQASGCSIDSQVRFIKEVGNALNVDFFDRLHFDFVLNEEVISIHKDEVQSKITSGELSADSLVLDHLVKTKAQFTSAWSVPLSQSWHKRLI